MAKCDECQAEVNIHEAREAFRSEFGEQLDYDEYGAGRCGGCAISFVDSISDHGRAIMMVNGDEDYDDHGICLS